MNMPNICEFVCCMALCVLTVGVVGCSEEPWHDWGERQYRIQREDDLVHVEIRDGKDIWDVDTRASAFHRYAVEVSSKDELLLKSSDIGSWLIGKQGGRWRVYVRENGEIRCINNEILNEASPKDGHKVISH